MIPALMQLKALEDAAAEASKAKEKGPPEGVVDAQRYVCRCEVRVMIGNQASLAHDHHVCTL